VNSVGLNLKIEEYLMTNEEPVEKLIFFRLIKNAQMQGTRNPEE
jgi:hypothetical protein